MKNDSATAIWKRIIQPSRGTLEPAAARALLKMRLPNRDLDRADVLAKKARDGKLTEKESVELENYLSIGTALEFLQAKARLTLKAGSP